MKISARVAVVGAVLATGSAIALPSALAAGKPHTTTVTLKSIAFHMSTVHIKKGDTVKFVFEDPHVTHNVTFKDGKHSPDKVTGTYSRKFTKAGTYTYRCTLHLGMNGKVIVK